MRKILFSKQQEEEILYLYTALNISITKIAENFNVSYGVIFRFLKSKNISIKHNDFYRSYSIDENFLEKIDSEEKAYFLGFFYADGHLNKKDGVEITIKVDDAYILEKFKKALKFEGPVNYSRGIYARLTFQNKKIASDLKNMGITNHKTHTCTFPYSFLPLELYPHFIRGYFDGDGSVSISKIRNYKDIQVTFTGNENMLISIKNILSGITKSQANVFPYKNRDAYSYKLQGKNICTKLYHYFYDEATIFLERKKNVFEQVIKD